MTQDVTARLGELLIVGLPGHELTPGAASDLRRIGPSGVIFFAPNFPDAERAARFTRAVHETIGRPDLPALVCVDEEGGMVSQLSGFWEVPPSARSVAASGGPPLVKDLAERTARRLLALGVNLNFAPCIDIHSNPLNPVIGIRSFGTTASQVTACGRAAIEGLPPDDRVVVAAPGAIAGPLRRRVVRITGLPATAVHVDTAPLPRTAAGKVDYQALLGRTPPVTADILESVTRATLLDLCRAELQLPAVERELDRTELYVSQEAFLCGSGWEITPVLSVDRLPLGDGKGPGPVTRAVKACYFDVVRGEKPAYRRWLTPVYNR